MLALETVVTRHGTALVLDASCTRVQVGLVGTGREPAWIVTEDEAGVGLFKAAAALLEVAGLKPQSVGAFVFCDGPGSQLGIRTAAMAIRTWQALRAEPAPIFTYRSLQLAAHGLAGSQRSSEIVPLSETPAESPHAKPGVGSPRPPSAGSEPRPALPFAVVCDARRESWFVTQVGPDGSVGPVERTSNEDLAKLGIPIHRPDGFRSWAEPPVPMIACDYTVGALFARLANVGLLSEADDAEPWTPAPPDYKKWSGERHRAPSPSAGPQ